MSAKLFLHLLVLCGIWSQGIIETFADEEITESSDLLHRQKRVVSYLPGEDISVSISEAPYVVRIREFRRSNCLGSILSTNVVITTATCVNLDPELYQVLSAASRLGNGNVHNVTEIRKHMENEHHRTGDGVALVIVNQQFVYTASCQPIRLHIGPVLLGSFGKVSGWGYNSGSANRGTDIYKNLRSIEVPIISHQDCVHRYPHIQISERKVCTYHPQRHSGHIDFGAGLVVDGNLAGVFLWSGTTNQIYPTYPDVFAYLQDSYYNNWIRRNLQSIDLYFQNQHHH